MPFGHPSPYRRGRFDVDAWRSRVRARLTSRFGLRLHMTLVVGLVFAVAFVTTRLMLALGVTSMGVRYLVACVIGYAAFFGLLRAWLYYVTSEAERDLDPDRSPDSVARAVDPDAPPRADAPPGAARRGHSSSVDFDVVPDLPVPTGGSGGGGGGGGGLSLDIDGDGCVAILIVGIVAIVALAVFGAAGYLVYQAPTVLGEAAFELVLASVLARSSRKVSCGDWTGSVLSATWKPALLMLAVATAGGFAAQALCPEASTLRGVIKQCVTDRPSR